MSVSETLREAIRRDGRSLNQLARDSGCDDSVLSRFMRDERTITARVLDRLCNVLGLDLRPAGKSRRGRKGGEA